MDLEIVDGVWFECVCEHMPYGKPICDWYEITSPAHDPHHAPAKKRIKRHSHKRLIPVLVIRVHA